MKTRGSSHKLCPCNHLTGIGVAWEPLKYGRKVMAVRLSTWRKSAAELAAAAAEQAAWRREAEGKLAALHERRA